MCMCALYFSISPLGTAWIDLKHHRQRLDLQWIFFFSKYSWIQKEFSHSELSYRIFWTYNFRWNMPPLRHSTQTSIRPTLAARRSFHSRLDNRNGIIRRHTIWCNAVSPTQTIFASSKCTLPLGRMWVVTTQTTPFRIHFKWRLFAAKKKRSLSSCTHEMVWIGCKVIWANLVYPMYAHKPVSLPKMDVISSSKDPAQIM